MNSINKPKFLMKKAKLFMLFFVIAAGLTACDSNDQNDQNEVAKPTASNIEIGLANNKRGLIGRDFHFNANILAGEKIADIQLKILPKTGETYAKDWKFELSFIEYKGAKNTNVHKHFSIPADAPEGKYDFFFIVLDENGSKLEIKEDFTILDPATMPADPIITKDKILRNGDLAYYNNEWMPDDTKIFKKNDTITLHTQVIQIMGDGILYSVLIKKSLNYRPESIDNLDFTKAIVITKLEHTGLAPSSKIYTDTKVNGVFGAETIVVGAEKDTQGNAITDKKSWESGQYNWVLLYKNTTYNISTFKSTSITISN